MDKFSNWYTTNQIEITWFIIGWLTMAGLEQLGRENYASALLDFGLVYFNYKMLNR